MNAEPYRPRSEACPVRESHDVTIEGASSAPSLTLTCRWPGTEEPRAFVVFCHGLGGSGRGYETLSRFWAAHGYLVIHPTFADWIGTVAASEPGLGLDPAAESLSGWTAMPQVRARMHEILHAPSSWMERIGIVHRVMAALDVILDATCGRPERAIPGAIAGHSFGAYTSQLLAGAEIDMPGQGAGRFRDDRFAAAILLSAQGRDQQGLREGSWDGLTGPVLTVTGTLDRGAGGQGWEWKSEPYDLSPPGGKILAVLNGADHYLGGLARDNPEAGLPEHRDAVMQLTLAFLDAVLTADGQAKSWLASISDRIGDCPVLYKRK